MKPWHQVRVTRLRLELERARRLEQDDSLILLRLIRAEAAATGGVYPTPTQLSEARSFYAHESDAARKNLETANNVLHHYKDNGESIPVELLEAISEQERMLGDLLEKSSEVQNEIEKMKMIAMWRAAREA